MAAEIPRVQPFAGKNRPYSAGTLDARTGEGQDSAVDVPHPEPEHGGSHPGHQQLPERLSELLRPGGDAIVVQGTGPVAPAAAPNVCLEAVEAEIYPYT